MSTERKILISAVIGTLLILGGGVFFLTKGENVNVPDDQILAKAGLHWHPKLTITINGEKKELDNSIGMAGNIHQEMHTHDEDYKQGVIHMEMKGVVTKDETKLGRFFQVWGKDFNSNKILDKEATTAGMIKMSVNGQQNNEFENYLMKDGDNIEIKYE